MRDTRKFRLLRRSKIAGLTGDRSGLRRPTPRSAAPRHSGPLHSPAGFSLLELLIAMAVFLVVAGAVFSLFSPQQTQYHQEQGNIGLNIGLRNAVTQLQLDLANAGTGYYNGANIPGFPVGITLVNNPSGTGCHTSGTTAYTAACFDTLNIVTVNSSIPATHVDGAGGCSNVTNSTIDADPASGLTAAQTAANYSAGDQVLLVSSNGKLIQSFVLTGPGQVSGSWVALQHDPTNADGTNSPADDPLGITTHANSKLGVTFCTTDWIMKLAPVTYQADTSDPSDPKLVRIQGGNSLTVMEQVIGFRVGANLFGSATGTAETTSQSYNYNAAWYINPALSNPPCPGSPDQTDPCDAYDFTLIRSVQISLIGRTAPSTDPNYTFRNSFDNGPYQVQGISVVVDPRNLSMND
jgi:prepilin-type N-terminal cleavage/methylation domain-containing protein